VVAGKIPRFWADLQIECLDIVIDYILSRSCRYKLSKSYSSGPRGTRQKKLQHLDPMQLEGGFGGMQLKIEMDLLYVIPHRDPLLLVIEYMASIR